ncbi:sensor histidine kinase [Gehongia tenuis]|nr:HAMP domain-containing sensor histidine kinase [Gehongia tenuis]
MKNNMLRKFKWKMFGKCILWILFGMLILFVLLYLADTLLNDVLANMVSLADRSLYLFFVRNKLETVLVLMVLFVVVAIYFTLNSTMKYFNLLIGSIKKVFQKDESLITLPNDFKEIENQLNTIKYDTLRNEQLAKEAEQRKNDLVVYLAHDLKTPLTSVIGYLSLLNEAEGMPEEQRAKYLSICLDKAERLEDLTNEFFEITRFNLQNITLEMGRVNLSLMLRQLADEFYPLFAAKGLMCRMEVHSDLVIQGDGDKLARVFDNILRNAINYGYENSEIEILARQVDEKVRIRFRNHGPRIPEEKLDHIFEKFYRLDSARSTRSGGAGLGLAIAKQIVELHHGSISAESGEDMTEFTVLLPLRAKK